MAVTNGVVVWPVEIADIQRVAGVVLQRTVGGVTQRKISGEIGVLASAVEGETVADDAGGTAWTVVSRIPINVWAKYKPVRFNQINTTKNMNDNTAWLNNDKTWNSYAQWWRYLILDQYNSNYHCGFTIPSSEINENIATNLGAWEYLRPRGRSYNEPRRFLDFNQYYPSAICPFVISLPSRAVLHNGLLRGLVKVWRQTPIETAKRALNLTLDDLFAVGSNQMWFGVAVIDITRNNLLLGAKTQDDHSDASISLEALASQVNDGDELLLIAFASSQKKSTWGGENTITAYSLEAPGIDFAVQGVCKVVSTLQTQYAIVITGLKPVDRTVLMPNVATANAGWVTAANRSYHGGTSPNPTYNYSIASVKCTCELVDISQSTREVIDEVYYEPNGPNANITVDPNPIEHNGGPYSQMRCSDNYHIGEPADPTTQYYQITYTLIYEQV